MPAQARTVVMPATMVAVSRAFKCWPHGRRRLRRDLPSRQRRLRRVLLGSLPLVVHAGRCGYLTLSHISSRCARPFGAAWEEEHVPPLCACAVSVERTRVGVKWDLFVAKGFYRVEGGGLPGGVDAEDQADDAGDGERGQGPDDAHLRGQHRAEDQLEQQCEQRADEDADDATEGAEGHGFQGELEHDGAPGGAES